MSDLGYPYALKPTEHRGHERFAWRFWPVSPKNVSAPLYHDVVAFNLHRQIAAIGYGDFPLYETANDRESFANDSGWNRAQRDIAFQFTWQMRRGDIIFTCQDTKFVVAWGLLLDNVPLFFGEDDPIWRELGPLRQRVWDEDQGEQFCNYRRVDHWRPVEAAPEIAHGRLPGSPQPTVMPYHEADIVQWLRIDEDLNAARLSLSEEVKAPEGYQLAPRSRSGASIKGPGRQLDKGRRTAVEEHAMGLAASYFKGNGYQVEDVSDRESFDLRCTKGKDDRLVEVKGTTLTASTVDLTANEVESAREYVTDLFVVSEILCTGHGEGAMAKGGNCRLFRNWEPEKRHLKPTAYRYTLPEGGKVVHVEGSHSEEE
ncbi:MAG: DUF3883 domain-containing protein [Planctomycetes bacterium]|nr:DUF3883 domain-containing protein [Planctomycetota bacterium]